MKQQVFSYLIAVALMITSVFLIWKVESILLFINESGFPFGLILALVIGIDMYKKKITGG